MCYKKKKGEYIMATKNNIRSIRFTDELADLIDRQQGKNFQQKFENLVTRCAFELPEKEAEIARLDEQRRAKLQQLRELDSKLSVLKRIVADLGTISTAVKVTISKYEA